MTKERQAITKSLTELLNGGHAHVTFEDAVAGVPPEFRDIKPEGLPYSIWQLVEHIRIAQWDILEFSRNPEYQSPEWPGGYWPSSASPPDDEEWKESVAQVKQNRQEFINLLQDTGHDLYIPFPYGNGQNLLREALLIADHTAYHVGEILVTRRILGIWKVGG